MFKKILLPVDLTESEMARPAIDEAIALAKGSDSNLRLVNVQSLVLPIYSDYVPPDINSQVRLAAELQIADVAAKIDYPHERISTAVRFGAAYDEVLIEAGEWGADLIVLCSHRPTITTYFLGSNATTIVRHAKCSVLVVR